MTKALFAALVIAAIWYLLKPAPKRVRMPDEEARAILGVDKDADPDTIRAAHRRLVRAVHPDKGGSAELTRRINAARDTLLRR